MGRHCVTQRSFNSKNFAASAALVEVCALLSVVLEKYHTMQWQWDKKRTEPRRLCLFYKLLEARRRGNSVVESVVWWSEWV